MEGFPIRHVTRGHKRKQEAESQEDDAPLKKKKTRSTMVSSGNGSEDRDSDITDIDIELWEVGGSGVMSLDELRREGMTKREAEKRETEENDNGKVMELELIEETKAATKTETEVKVDLEKKTKAETKTKSETKTKAETMAKVETKDGTKTETKVIVDSETKAETQTDKMLEKKGMSSTTTLKEEGNEKFENGDFDGAMSCYTQALEISDIKETEKVVIFKNRAMCRLKVDDFEGAVSDATKALEIAPNDHNALCRRFTAYERLGKVEEAYRDAAMLKKVASKNPLVNRLTSINRKKMSSTTTLKEEGNDKFRNGDFDGAMSCYSEALEISDIKETEKAVIFKNRAMCRLKVDDFEGAVSDATKALEIAPNDSKALYRRCTAYERLGKVEDAYRDAAMLIKVDPKNTSVQPILNRLTPIISHKEDVFTGNVSMATGGRAENGEKWASQLLSQLCEDVGFSEEEWRLRLRECDVRSTSDNYNEPIFKTLYSGSSSEGLSADILGSDLDVTCVLSGIKVTERDVVSPDEENDVYKAISLNHPAFYMMNLLQRGTTSLIGVRLRVCLEEDPHGRMLVLNGSLFKTLCNTPGNDISSQTVEHGPALAGTGVNGHKVDYVMSLHCPSWPSVSEEWKHRLKPSGWPSPELVNRVTQLGCEFVPTGNPLSLHNELEWRLSSSAAERVLIRSFNIVQIQSYFLLKLVRVYLIEPCVPESLCSYHMKNIILWQVEKTDPRTWRRDNLVQCFNECLKALYQCLENGNLPHYFIPQQNLFYPKIQGEVRRKLISVVGGLVQEGWLCLLRCAPFTNTAIGCIHEVPRCPCYIRDMARQKTQRKVIAVYEQLVPILTRTMVSLDKCTEDCFEQTMSNIQTLQMNTLTDELYRPSRSFIDILNTAMSNHLAYMMLNDTRGSHDRNLKSAEHHLEHNCDVDLTSCRLKLATFYYILGDVHKCIRIVHDVRLKYTTKTFVVTADPFRQRKCAQTPRHWQKGSELLSRADDIRDVLRHVSFPVLFSPWEITNAPPAVQGLALHRRFESSQERNSSKVVAIDSLVYAYYLLTISYMEIGTPDQAKKSLDYLERVLLRPDHYQIYFPYEAEQLVNHIKTRLGYPD